METQNENIVYIKVDKHWKKTLEYSNEERTEWQVIKQTDLEVEEVMAFSIEKVMKYLKNN